MGRLIFIKLANWWRVCVLKSNLADLGLLFLLRHYLYLVATKSSFKDLFLVLIVFTVFGDFMQLYFILSNSADLMLLSLPEHYQVQVVTKFVVYPFKLKIFFFTC